jgi:hypothetical protein
MLTEDEILECGRKYSYQQKTPQIPTWEMCMIKDVLKAQLAKCQPLIEAPLREEIAELKAAYEDYIKLLGDELNDTVSIASAHGWKSTRYEQGVKCREAIAKLQKGESPNKNKKNTKLFAYSEGVLDGAEVAHSIKDLKNDA